MYILARVFSTIEPTPKEILVRHQPSVLPILCLRHGETKYTGQPNDLTLEGESHVRHIAGSLVSSWMCASQIAHRNLAIVSSPAPRARYTAEVVAEVLGYKGPIRIRNGLQPMIWRDPVRALAACKGLSGKGYVDYETEPVFADSTIFETPDEVKKRWYAFFSEHVRFALRFGPKHAIFVSHYEVFCSIVRDLFGIVATEATALRYVEPIYLHVITTADVDQVVVVGGFRHRVAAVKFHLPTCSFHPV